MAEFAVEARWSVYRVDVHGLVYEMRQGLSYERASDISHQFNAKGHHQGYWPDLPENQPTSIPMIAPDTP